MKNRMPTVRIADARRDNKNAPAAVAAGALETLLDIFTPAEAATFAEAAQNTLRTAWRETLIGGGLHQFFRAGEKKENPVGAEPLRLADAWARGDFPDIVRAVIFYAGRAVAENSWQDANAAHYWSAQLWALRTKPDFSSMGKAGAIKRHAPNAELRAWTVEQYRRGSWPSKNKAAHDLVERVIEHGRKIGVGLSPSNAQRTIVDWLRKDV